MSRGFRRTSGEGGGGTQTTVHIGRDLGGHQSRHGLQGSEPASVVLFQCQYLSNLPCCNISAVLGDHVSRLVGFLLTVLCFGEPHFGLLCVTLSTFNHAEDILNQEQTPSAAAEAFGVSECSS